MSKTKNRPEEEQWQSADEEVRKNLPPSVKLVRTLRGHTKTIGHIAWSPDGLMLASPSDDRTIRLWDTKTGRMLRILRGNKDAVGCVAFYPSGRWLASGSDGGKVILWDAATGDLLYTLNGDSSIGAIAFSPTERILAIGDWRGLVRLWDMKSDESFSFKADKMGITNLAFDPTGQILATAGYGEGKIVFWEMPTKKRLHTLELHRGLDLVFDPTGRILAGNQDSAVQIWETPSGRLQRSIEGHTSLVNGIAFSPNGRLLATSGFDGNLFLWDCEKWQKIATLPTLKSDNYKVSCHRPAFHPTLPLLASIGSEGDSGRVIRIFELDVDFLLGQSVTPSVTYTSAKIVLVGDSGVGKTGLGWRLAHGKYKKQDSTHGQQFWLLKQLCKQRNDGAQCEAVLWDLAGQDDYRLIHALFLDDADLALLLFDPTHKDDPLSGVEFWLRQLKVEAQPPSGTPTMLIAARSDRGTPRLTLEELQVFCQQRGIASYLPTSAKSGEGIEELVRQMHEMIPWDAKSATVTTETFKRIKDFVLDLKEDTRRREVILTQEELRQRLEKTDPKWKFSDDEMITAIGHLATHGYVTRLRTSKGELRILLAPELLNNLAASFVLEARRNQKGLGSLEEQRLLSGEYKFPELENLTGAEKDILLDSAVVLFLEHNVCFRETDPLNGRAYLVFPELINLRKPLITDDAPTEDGVAYTVSGAVENVYASLVVLMGYTQTFTRTNQWRDHARYEVGGGHVCGFRLESERAGELDFVFYFGTNTPAPSRMLFQSLFESFLARRNLTVRRYEPVVCPKGHTLNRDVIRQRMSSGAGFAFCSECGRKLKLPKADKPIQLTKQEEAKVAANSRAADKRSRFEQVLFRLKNYAIEQKIAMPDCFISYAWGNSAHEHWVERNLATDLQKAGIMVVLDRWENSRIGASITRFVERVAETNRVIVVGTSLYRKKYDNKEPMQGFVVAAEGALISLRMIGTELGKESVLPLLLEGTEKSAFPPLLQGRVYADFRRSEAYFDTMLNLLLSLYQIPPQHPVATELHESLKGKMER
jgi:small GTP-binding protein